MIDARGKNPFKAKAPALAARDAARRFAMRRGNARSRSGPWRPVVLRWRQRLKRLESVTAGRAARPANVLWFPQFHFHFATHASDRTRSDRSVGSLPTARIHQLRVSLEHRWTNVRADTPFRLPRWTHRPSRDMSARHPSRPHVHAGMTTATRAPRPTTVQPIAPPAAQRPRALVFGRIPERARASTQREGQMQSLPRFPTHFATHASDRTRSDRSVGSLPTARIHQSRVSLEHRWTRVRADTPFQLPRWMNRPSRDISARHPSRPHVHAGMTTATRAPRPTTVQPIAPPAAQRPRALVFGRIPERARASTQREERTPRLPGLRRSRQVGLQQFPLRGSTRVESIPHRSTASKAMRFPFDPSEELVWRRGLPSTTVMAENRRPSERSESSQGPPMRPLSSQETGRAGSPAIERAAVLPMAKLDPGLMDRLTDDVIRRVEQRMRIERQRRGL